MPRFVAPLVKEPPTLGWSFFFALVLVTLPFGGLLLIGYSLWCRRQQKKSYEPCPRCGLPGDVPYDNRDGSQLCWCPSEEA